MKNRESKAPNYKKCHACFEMVETFRLYQRDLTCTECGQAWTAYEANEARKKLDALHDKRWEREVAAERKKLARSYPGLTEKELDELEDAYPKELIEPWAKRLSKARQQAIKEAKGEP